MNYFIIGLLVIIIILLCILLSKRIDESNITERIAKLELSLTKDITEFKLGLSKDLNEDFNRLNNQLEGRLLAINEKVNERLEESFDKTNKTFMNVLERLSKIDEAQRKIETLSTDIVDLQSILTDKKTRGIFGEVNLNHILKSVFGEKNDRLYKLQQTLSTGVIADSVVFAPKPLGMIAIDSKFPLENYQMMVNKKLTQNVRDEYEKNLDKDQKHQNRRPPAKRGKPSHQMMDSFCF